MVRLIRTPGRSENVEPFQPSKCDFSFLCYNVHEIYIIINSLLMFWNVKLWHFLRSSTRVKSFPLYELKYAKCSNNFTCLYSIHTHTHLRLCIENIKTHIDNCSGQKGCVSCFSIPIWFSVRVSEMFFSVSQRDSLPQHAPIPGASSKAVLVSSTLWVDGVLLPINGVDERHCTHGSDRAGMQPTHIQYGEVGA